MGRDDQSGERKPRRSHRTTGGRAGSNACGDTSSAVGRSAREPTEEDAIHCATSVGILSFQGEEDVKRRTLCSMTLSARNRLEGKVVEIQFGGVMAHVVMRVGKNLIESVITKRSADEMKLKVGDKVSAVIKSTEVMLEKD
jgi:molybdopterin-binding protein